jgi:hypothetical protein
MRRGNCNRGKLHSWFGWHCGGDVGLEIMTGDNRRRRAEKVMVSLKDKKKLEKTRKGK